MDEQDRPSEVEARILQNQVEIMWTLSHILDIGSDSGRSRLRDLLNACDKSNEMIEKR
jgi:hypothetical protein